VRPSICGARLPSERELAERFGVSRVVIREAEITLEALGRVEIKVGSGVFVRSPQPGGLATLPAISAFELTQTRLIFESECAALTAKMINNDQIDELSRAVEMMRVEHSGVTDGADSDHTFHRLISRATGNEANVYVLENLWRVRTEVDTVRSVYAAVCQKDAAHRFEEHNRIFEAIRDRNADGARIAMKEHFSRLIEAMLDVSERQAIDEIRQRSLSNRERYLKTVSPT
jgi:DNA-binding FadR family transcriptional regulator